MFISDYALFLLGNLQWFITLYQFLVKVLYVDLQTLSIFFYSTFLSSSLPTLKGTLYLKQTGFSLFPKHMLDVIISKSLYETRRKEPPHPFFFQLICYQSFCQGSIQTLPLYDALSILLTYWPRIQDLYMYGTGKPLFFFHY